jgi:hypothetical protein
VVLTPFIEEEKPSRPNLARDIKKNSSFQHICLNRHRYLCYHFFNHNSMVWKLLGLRAVEETTQIWDRVWTGSKRNCLATGGHSQTEKTLAKPQGINSNKLKAEKLCNNQPKPNTSCKLQITKLLFTLFWFRIVYLLLVFRFPRHKFKIGARLRPD